MARSSMRRRGAAGLALAAVVLIGAGCGSSDEDAPAACLATGDAYRQALQAAPGAVRLGGRADLGLPHSLSRARASSRTSARR